jgi:hypothetical protein
MPKIIKKIIREVSQDSKSFGKQFTTENPVLVKNENTAILIYSGKTHKRFLEEFEKLTIDGFKLSGISDPMGFPILGLDIKFAKIFFFQHLPAKLW